MAFLDGNQPDRLCAPMVDHDQSGGGDVRSSASRSLSQRRRSVKHLKMANGEEIVADEYVSAVPVDVMKRMMPEAVGSTCRFFQQIQELEGIPVINIHLWFDRKLQNVDHLCFSRSPLLSVYADMSTTCKEYYDEEKSMLELVFAPCSPIAGGNTNWIAKSNQEIVDATMKELERLFPLEIGPGSPDGVGAKLSKHAVVKTPRSVYAAIPGRNKYRPRKRRPSATSRSRATGRPRSSWARMEGAVLGGKLAAEVVTDKAVYGASTKGLKKIMPDVIAEARTLSAKDPVGAVEGESAVTFGAGAVMTERKRRSWR